MFTLGSEARLIVPYQDKAGNAADVDHYQAMAIEVAGGATRYDAHGSWLDDNGNLVQEPVAVLDIACEPGSAVENSLMDLAGEVAEDLNQDAVYFRDASGKVHLIDQDDRPAA
jgi:uncharacterized protein YdeI (BOF family)